MGFSVRIDPPLMPAIVHQACPKAVPMPSRRLVLAGRESDTFRRSDDGISPRVPDPGSACGPHGRPASPDRWSKAACAPGAAPADANRVVPRKDLIEELFVGQSVNSADHALRNHVSRLREGARPVANDAPRLVARAPGYLWVEPGELDLERFEWLVAEGREALAVVMLERRWSRCRLPKRSGVDRPLADIEFEGFTRVDVERLEELRLGAVEARSMRELAFGYEPGRVAELETLVVEHPFRERFRAAAHARAVPVRQTGRGSRGVSADEAAPDRRARARAGVELQQLERAILVQDPALNLNADRRRETRLDRTTASAPSRVSSPSRPTTPDIFFGRERLVEELVGRLADAPLLAIVGPSGSGKSSLLPAGRRAGARVRGAGRQAERAIGGASWRRRSTNLRR